MFALSTMIYILIAMITLICVSCAIADHYGRKAYEAQLEQYKANSVWTNEN